MWKRIFPMTILVVLIGCSSTHRPRTESPYATSTSPVRDTVRAQMLTSEAATLIASDPEKAESLLREALIADLFHGPAHNNLGALYLQQDKLYEAASEFEWARKLMPGHPDPRMNLAVTLERAGRIDDAIASYDTALEVYPEHLPTMQALARCQLRHARTDDRTGDMLETIALRSADKHWRDWARGQLARLP